MVSQILLTPQRGTLLVNKIPQALDLSNENDFLVATVGIHARVHNRDVAGREGLATWRRGVLGNSRGLVGRARGPSGMIRGSFIDVTKNHGRTEGHGPYVNGRGYRRRISAGG
ncbi:hypothetical protein B0H67DRAFT_327564 [Lasiosphaeris hirsuta]|uniref:Uncharacterized protein n=1 Tax=Lasiosphaeris hirsuta TaxID=260670 RepID=A0AA40A2G3_9PEZI|nr:hypothetical protein B0H67DRAFT_327564 [Lasiosphaeris hirsuta]